MGQSQLNLNLNLNLAGSGVLTSNLSMSPPFLRQKNITPPNFRNCLAFKATPKLARVLLLLPCWTPPNVTTQHIIKRPRISLSKGNPLALQFVLPLVFFERQDVGVHFAHHADLCSFLYWLSFRDFARDPHGRIACKINTMRIPYTMIGRRPIGKLRSRLASAHDFHQDCCKLS